MRLSRAQEAAHPCPPAISDGRPSLRSHEVAPALPADTSPAAGRSRLTAGVPLVEAVAEDRSRRTSTASDNGAAPSRSVSTMSVNRRSPIRSHASRAAVLPDAISVAPLMYCDDG